MIISDNLLVLLTRPLVKLCVKSGIRIVELYAVLKRTFVECAKEELLSGNHKVNTSRLSLMTGLQRPEVEKFIKVESVPPKNSSITSLIGLWNHHHRFIGKDGKPRPLTYEGPKSDFSRLVKMTSKELNPYTVLFELERAALVKKIESRVTLNSSIYLKKEISEGFEALARDSEDLTEGIWENITSTEKLKNLHLRLDLDKIPSEKILEVKKTILELGHQCMSIIQNKLSKYDEDFDNKTGTTRDSKYHAISVTLFSMTKER